MARPTISKAPVSQQFANPVHCVKIANDGLVYVCDRINNRIQVFKKDGSFVKEWFFEKNTLGNGAVWDVAIWPDPKQSYLSSADGENNEIRVLKRGDGSVVGTAMAAMPDSFTGFTRWRRQQGRRVYRQGRHGKAHPEIPADLGCAALVELQRVSQQFANVIRYSGEWWHQCHAFAIAFCKPGSFGACADVVGLKPGWASE